MRSQPQAGPSAAPPRTRRQGPASAPSSAAGDSAPDGPLIGARWPRRTRNPPGEWWKVQPTPSPESSPAPEPALAEPSSAAENSEDEVTSSLDPDEDDDGTDGEYVARAHSGDSESVPRSMSDALKREDGKQWQAAAEVEINAHLENGT